MITEIHQAKPPTKKQAYSQSKKVASAIIQAEEYFRFGAQAPLSVSPNLLYYGSVALVRALTLILLDGKESNSRLHANHGLSINHGQLDKLKASSTPIDYFKHISCNIRTGQDNRPIGLFYLLNELLCHTGVGVPVRHLDKRYEGFDFNYKHWVSSGSHKRLDLNHDGSISANTLLRSLPDLYDQREYFSDQNLLFPGSASIVSMRKDESRFYKFLRKHLTDKKPEDYDFLMMTCAVNSIDESSKQTLLSRYRRKNPFIQVVDPGLGNRTLMFNVPCVRNHHDSKAIEPQWFPEIISASSGQLFYIVDPTIRIHELAAIHCLLFQLSSACRYYSDAWIQLVRGSFAVAETLRIALSSTLKRLPGLIKTTIQAGLPESDKGT